MIETPRPNTQGRAALKTQKTTFQAIIDEIKQQLPESRERSIAITKIEEASMWLSKAICIANPEE